MKKYLITFFGGNAKLRFDNLEELEEEVRERHLTTWRAWMTALAKANKLELGYPLKADGKRVDSNGTEDYHFPDTVEGGFVLLNAGSLDEAVEIAESSPIVKNGGYVLVRPCGEIDKSGRNQ
jgi:hypothetical protein